MPLRFSVDDWAAITHHLRIAAEQYDRDVVTMQADPAHAGLVEQFTRQAAQARTLAERIEDEAGV